MTTAIEHLRQQRSTKLLAEKNLERGNENRILIKEYIMRNYKKFTEEVYQETIKTYGTSPQTVIDEHGNAYGSSDEHVNAKDFKSCMFDKISDIYETLDVVDSLG